MVSRLHLGCGPEVKDGWINIDGYGDRHGSRGGTQRLVWDLTLGLPRVDFFGDPIDGVDYIYSCHFFEHLRDDDAIRLIRDCRDVLVVGGVFRVALPDFRSLAEAYVREDWSFLDLLDWDEFSNAAWRTYIDAITYGVYQDHANPFERHQSIWDVKKALAVLNHCGFTGACLTPYDDSIDPAIEVRRRHTFVCCAVKE